MSNTVCDQRHGMNRVQGSVKKAGSNKGVLAARRARKRIEAEARNARTLPENRRAYRQRLWADAA